MNGQKIREILEVSLKEAMQRNDRYDKSLWESMEYSLLAGGKRVRPVLLILTGLSLGASMEELLPFAEALEMIHTYSLIHDDLPAMDNDDYRRGRLTNHKVYGEATAILAGDGLLTLAFEIMGEAMVKAVSNGNMELVKNYAQAESYLAHCAGTKGMVAGQIADLQSEGRMIDLEELTYIEFNKTSRLLMAAMVGGALIAGKGLPEVDPLTKALEEAAGNVGKAFQIVDDVLDIESTLEELGKMPLSDEKEDKATFVSLYGTEKAKQVAKELTEEALSKIDFLQGSEAEELKLLVKALAERKS